MLSYRLDTDNDFPRGFKADTDLRKWGKQNNFIDTCATRCTKY